MLAKNRRLHRHLNRKGLCISRDNGQQTILDLPDGSAVVITSRASGGRRVRLHIAAPPAVRIRRAELSAENAA